MTAEQQLEMMMENLPHHLRTTVSMGTGPVTLLRKAAADVIDGQDARIKELEGALAALMSTSKDALKEARNDALREAVSKIDSGVKKEQANMTRWAQKLSSRKEPSTKYAIKRAGLCARISCRDKIAAMVKETPHEGNE